ncbi:hypothetical protein AVEN_66917-1 [Araneus ventricosus]|uniref:Uncharacterized protein n=1 Tax=Araneus ventricosus TaxID=182803 RepID=A0A4Y2SQ74_ARAVE|nr:hypothetical protein AVEN_66917-1 [Araneus ventricosus]
MIPSTPVEEILKKELSKYDFNIQNIKKVQNKGFVVVCYKEEDTSKLVTPTTYKKNITAKIETKAGRQTQLDPHSLQHPQINNRRGAVLDFLVLPNPPKLKFKLRGKEQDTSQLVMEALG